MPEAPTLGAQAFQAESRITHNSQVFGSSLLGCDLIHTVHGSGGPDPSASKVFGSAFERLKAKAEAPGALAYVVNLHLSILSSKHAQAEARGELPSHGAHFGVTRDEKKNSPKRVSHL